MKLTTLVAYIATGTLVTAMPTAIGTSPAQLTIGSAKDDKRATASIPSLSDTSFINAVVKAHNDLRKHHSAQPLSWDGNLAIDASNEAGICDGNHHGDWGQNIGAIGPVPDDLITSTSSIIKAWYDEIKLYDFNKPGFSHETGHFTQVVWRGSQRVGCAWVVCSGKAFPARLYCDYDPRGNYVNEGMFAQNVWQYV